MPSDDIDTLAKLIWSTLKLRGTLLLLSTLVLILVWSSLEKGNTEVPSRVDVPFCNDLVKKFPALFPNGSTSICTATAEENNAREVIEGMRNWLAAPQIKRFAPDLAENFATYDRDRRTKYKLELEFSSGAAGGTVVFNALTIAEFMPFLALAVFAAVVILGFQEKYCKTKLMECLNQTQDSERGLAIARSRFLVGLPLGSSDQAKPSFRTFAMAAFAPEPLVMGVLYLLYICSFALLLHDFSDNVVHLTDSVFFSYTFALYTAAFVATWLLFKTKNLYRSLSPAGNAVRHQLHFPAILLKHRQSLGLLAAAIGLLSFSLSWLMQLEYLPNWPFFHATMILRGYRFLLEQQPLYLHNSPILLSSQTFSEIQVQLWFAIGFLFVSSLGDVARLGRPDWIGHVYHKVCGGMSIAILFLGLNYCLYMCVLWYQLTFGVPWPDRLPSLEGLSMINFAPAGGFWVFISC